MGRNFVDRNKNQPYKDLTIEEAAKECDVSPEGLTFVPASVSTSGNAEIIVAHEVSGTVGIYELTTLSSDNNDTSKDDDSDDESKDDESESIPENNDQNDNTVEDTKETTNKTEGTETVNTGDVQNPMLWAWRVHV